MWQQASPESIGRYLALANELTPLAKEAQDWSALGTASVFRCAIAYIYADRAAWTAATADLDLSVRGTGQPFIAFMRRSGDYAQAFLDGDFAAAARVAEDLLTRAVVRPRRHRGHIRPADVHDPAGNWCPGAGQAPA